MKLKINKACDLSSISVLPPHARRSNAVLNGTVSSVFSKSQASQHRSQQSQQSFSQGVSSQHGMFSQLSQNSLDEIITNDQRFGSQERENSTKMISCLPPINYTREECQMPISRSSTTLMRKGNSAVPGHRCQISEELEHRIGMIGNSLSSFGMILDSIQSDIMQANKATKEVALEMESIRQKFIVHDNSLQQMAMAYSLKIPYQKHLNLTAPPLKAINYRATPQEMLPLKNPAVHSKVQQAAVVPKIEMGTWNSVKPEQANFTDKDSNKGHKQKGASPIDLEREGKVIRESDEEIDVGFSCLLVEKETGNYSIEEAKEETERILRKARRRKRKYCNTIIIN